MRPLTKLAAASMIAVASVGAATLAWANAEADTPSSIVEDFGYSNADQIVADHGVKPDGSVLLVDCAVPGDVIQVRSHDQAGFVCFQLRGSTG